ncbi:MAG: glutamine-hydrolyzing carbamoyl-phosphate synthase small subunit [Candidatus Omnitrophica bacterium]|nr:glutamine-hydrolyzing carbamoyl-phosphate synthase small subunit [Candidatus Omnitrophota bacterium]
MKAVLVLEDGSVFSGLSIGSPGERIGKVVLNTAVVGYQEQMTDPANAGKILVMTYPLIGNYGVAKKFYESKQCWLAGAVIKEASRIYSNWQAEGPFEGFLEKENTVCISDVDTRTIAITIRDSGEMFGIISTKTQNKEALLKKVKEYKKKPKNDFVREISVDGPVEVVKNHSGPRIAVLDLGMTNSFIKQLKTLGCSVTLLPYDTPADEIIAMKPDGLVISNGPEEDVSVLTTAQTVKTLLGRIPMLGISTGHHIIGIALGAKLKRLKVGHRGVNYPVKNPNSYKGDITVQNHSVVVDDSSFKNRRDIEITLRNVNDNSIEEMESRALKFISTQYYPVSPGFDEVNNAFKRFLDIGKKQTARQHKKEVEYAKA